VATFDCHPWLELLCGSDLFGSVRRPHGRRRPHGGCGSERRFRWARGVPGVRWSVCRMAMGFCAGIVASVLSTLRVRARRDSWAPSEIGRRDSSIDVPSFSASAWGLSAAPVHAAEPVRELHSTGPLTRVPIGSGRGWGVGRLSLSRCEHAERRARARVSDCMLIDDPSLAARNVAVRLRWLLRWLQYPGSRIVLSPGDRHLRQDGSGSSHRSTLREWTTYLVGRPARCHRGHGVPGPEGV